MFLNITTMNRRITAIIATALSVMGCAAGQTETTGTRVAALDDGLWQESEWIAAADAPVVDG